MLQEIIATRRYQHYAARPRLPEALGPHDAAVIASSPTGQEPLERQADGVGRSRNNGWIKVDLRDIRRENDGTHWGQPLGQGEVA